MMPPSTLTAWRRSWLSDAERPWPLSPPCAALRNTIIALALYGGDDLAAATIDAVRGHTTGFQYTYGTASRVHLPATTSSYVNTTPPKNAA